MDKKILYITLFLLSALTPAVSQRPVNATGTAEVLQTEEMSAVQAREKALELAKVNAIESKFGTFIEQTGTTIISGGESSYNVIGEAKVKGEWLGMNGEPEFESETRMKPDGTPETWWKCTVRGKVRELAAKVVNFETASLNGPDKLYAAEVFNSLDYFYLYFKSAVDGYLTVFIDEPFIVKRMLPYSGMTGEYLNYVPVRADQEYIFFSRDHNSISGISGTDVDAIRLYTRDELETDIVYVIFSTDPFVKPILEGTKETEQKLIIPKSLEKEAFNEWFTDNMISNPNFQYQKLLIQIKGR